MTAADEMCLVLVYYYPRTDNMLVCLGGLVQDSYAEGFGTEITSLLYDKRKRYCIY